MSLAAVDDPLRVHLKLPKDQGLTVTSLEAHSPAALAGIQQNDVLLKLGDTSLGKPEDLEEALKAAGDKPVALQVLRGGRRVNLKVQPRVRVALGPVQPESPTFWIGVSVAPIEPALRAQLELPQKHGLLAIDVVKDGPAAKAGVQPHDILLKLDGEELTNQAKLIGLVQARGEKPIPVEFVRAGNKQTVVITPQRRKGSRVSLHSDQPRTFRFDVVHPGAVLRGREGGLGAATADFDGDGVLDVLTVEGRDATPKAPRDGEASTAKRLDDLAAQVKELRQAIEALTKAAQEKK